MDLFVRIRPSEEDHTPSCTIVSEVQGFVDKTVVTTGGGNGSQTKHSKGVSSQNSGHVFMPDACQHEVIERTIVPHLRSLTTTSGYSCVFLAYGQTGSGKTHTIFSPPTALTAAELERSSGLPGTWGLFPWAAATLVSGRGVPGSRVRIALSAVEVYMDRVYDLLNDRALIAISSGSAKATANRVHFGGEAQRDASGKWIPPAVSRKQNAETTANATNSATEVTLQSVEDVLHYAQKVDVIRSASTHNLNIRSSRSHALLTLRITSVAGDGVVQSLCQFVDLAGSERVSKSGVDADASGLAKAFNLCGSRMRVALPGTRMDEAKSVNSSLSALGRVLAAMARRDAFISYRDSPLTELLKPALTVPTVRITVFLNLRSEASNDPETRSTLRFGSVCAAAGGSSSARRRSSSCALPRREKKASADPSRAQLQEEAMEQLVEVQTDIQRMKAQGLDCRINEEGFAAPTVKSFKYNKAKMEESKRQLVVLKAELSEAKNEGNAQKIAMLQEKMAVVANEVNVYTGLFLRQVSTGIYTDRDPRLQLKMKEEERLLKEIEFLQHRY